MFGIRSLCIRMGSGRQAKDLYARLANPNGTCLVSGMICPSVGWVAKEEYWIQLRREKSGFEVLKTGFKNTCQRRNRKEIVRALN